MVLTVRESYDFVMDVSGDRSLLHLLVSSSNSTVTDVVPDFVIKQDGVLRDNANVRAQRGLLHLRHNQTYQLAQELPRKNVKHKIQNTPHAHVGTGLGAFYILQANGRFTFEMS